MTKIETLEKELGFLKQILFYQDEYIYHANAMNYGNAKRYLFFIQNAKFELIKLGRPL